LLYPETTAAKWLFPQEKATSHDCDKGHMNSETGLGRPGRTQMKEIVAVIFGLGLVCNALLFVPQAVAVWRKKSDEGISLVTFGGFSVLQAIGIVHGVYQRDLSLILGMAASLLTCGTVTALTVFYRARRRRAQIGG
jgi:MtN3 and saliva related transmembrane protein